jgi:hypothetical protein
MMFVFLGLAAVGLVAAYHHERITRWANRNPDRN